MMRRTFYVIDTHTQGNPTRVIIGGFSKKPGKTIMEKMLYLKKNLDHIVSGIIWEPPRNEHMGAAIKITTTNEQAYIGRKF